jgi:signal transduction histidine kinase
MHLPRQSSTPMATSADAAGSALGSSDGELPFRFVESLGLLGHELRNALSCITSATAMMRALSPDAGQERTRLAMIDRAARRMGHIVSNTLDYAQALRGALTVEPQRMDLRSACEEVIEEALAAYPVAICLRSSGSPWGWWDPVAIAQVLSNIIRNAVVHGAADEPIIVDLRGTSLFISVTVTNRGPSIPPELLPSLFEPFRRGTSGGQRSREGHDQGRFEHRAGDLFHRRATALGFRRAEGGGTGLNGAAPRVQWTDRQEVIVADSWCLACRAGCSTARLISPGEDQWT